MQTDLIVPFINLFFAGTLAGMEMALHYGVHSPTTVLDDRAQLQLRKALVLRIRLLVPAFFLPTLLSALALIYLQGMSAGFALRMIGLVGLLVWIGLRVVGTVPINSATLDWDIAAPPPDWKAQVAHAERFHSVGVWAVVVCFACFLASAALSLGVS